MGRQTLRAGSELCQRRTVLGTSVEPTPRSTMWGQGGGGTGPARLTSPNQGLFNCSGQWLWKECLAAPNSHRERQGEQRLQRNSWGTFFCCSGGLKPLKLARLPRKRFYKAHCPFHKSYPHPLLPPPPISAFLFPSKLLGQIQFGKKQVASAAATATAAAERVLACSHR